MTLATFHIDMHDDNCLLNLAGDWQLGQAPLGADICAELPSNCQSITLITTELSHWDSSLAIALLQLSRWCEQKKIPLDTQQTPQGLQQLLQLATDVPVYQPTNDGAIGGLWPTLRRSLIKQGLQVHDGLVFVGDCTLVLGRWLGGKARTRRSDIVFFIEQAGPKGLAIVTLISLLVGMILAYLGSVQLRQLGAQVYVANLVAIGMVREMGALMTGVIMAGRTGAAYAAQLGTMQVNEEIDALRVMGIPTMEFLVLPRLLALIFIMPLMCIYSDVIGMIGGALVANGMGVSYTQYILQTQVAIDWVDISTGLIKSLIFGFLIAIAGCQAGLLCGRDSNAVGLATTQAVVKAIVFLVVADAALNILYDKLGI
ncbi:MlaE family ABC transporter permease [Shewanella frigidimarina]|uniref:MlaE family ABC transporter permease n=1 Tax=Shewanella frigidimarina TaxID=56812 RepID=UPI003F9FDE61